MRTVHAAEILSNNCRIRVISAYTPNRREFSQKKINLIQIGILIVLKHFKRHCPFDGKMTLLFEMEDTKSNGEHLLNICDSKR